MAVFTGAIYSLRGQIVSNETLHKLRNDVLERPDDVEAWYELAAAALDEGALEEARAAMTHVLERAPDHLGAHRVLAVIEGQLGRNREAIDLWRRVVALSGGDDVEALTRLGIALSMDGRHDEAIRILSDVAGRRGGASAAHADLGMALLAARRPDAALAAFQRACDLDPRSAQAHCGLGLVYQQLGRWWEAAKSFRKTEELAPDSPVGPMNLAMVLETLGEHGQARQALARAAALAPDDQEIRQALEQLPGPDREEEEVTRPAFPDQASIKGDLRTFNLLDVLEFLRVQGQTGQLMVSSPRGAGVVRLTHGRVVSAGAPGLEPLGQALVDQHLLGVADLQASLARAASDDEEALEAQLWEDARVDRARLGELMLGRIMASLDELLEWREGNFSFHGATRAPFSALSFDLQEVTLRLAARRDERPPAARS